MQPIDGFDRPVDKVVSSLRERAKELNCLYEVEACLNQPGQELEEAMVRTAGVIGAGMQYPEVCEASIEIGDQWFESSDFEPTEWVLKAQIAVQQEPVGTLRIYYLEERPPADAGPFLREEIQLARSIADRLGHYLLFRQVQDMRQGLDAAGRRSSSDSARGWLETIRLLRSADRDLYLRVARKMLNHLVQMGVQEASGLLQRCGLRDEGAQPVSGERNAPWRRHDLDESVLLSSEPFELAAFHLGSDEVLSRVAAWMQEDRAGMFITAVRDYRSSIREIADALRRFNHAMTDGDRLPQSVMSGLRVSLIRRFLTEQLQTIMVAKEFVDPSDFSELFAHMIVPPNSQGRVGGKAAGLFLAHRILSSAVDGADGEVRFRVPKTWYLPSDAILDFIAHNDLGDVVEQKYKEIDLIRQEYPNIIQLFKNSAFPQDIVNGLSVALDDLGDTPLIVRSSSLLEDRLGTAFSGKYKSLFLANQGTKHERLEALLDAISEIYGSIFGPDPIEYRRERGLLDFNEEMGILIQQVVGKRVGRYFLPAFGGVAFSNNEFRWSPRIERKDGLIRLVPGLGTRAVDRTSSDHPILAVPGQPALRVNATVTEVVRYSPRMADVIDLETNQFETIELDDLLRECGDEYPAFEQVFSIVSDGMLRQPSRLTVDFERDELAATFEGLIGGTPFVSDLGRILKILEERLATPVDIEFAHDGTDFYLLQCRPQSYAGQDAPAAIPKDLPAGDVIFTANRYVSNGRVPELTHVVYVDPLRYGQLEERAQMLEVGRVIGRLNKLLPKRKFLLMGPGRWGSRGDVKLGVSVTYSDISNTAMLIEIARKQGNYVPDLSFGTHFFQDLVESRIRYLPLYPDDPGIEFHEKFLRGAGNLLAILLPEYASLADVVRVIDVPAVTSGRVLKVLMNADLDEAVAILDAPGDEPDQAPRFDAKVLRPSEHYWRWRLGMAERIAAELDPVRFGVVALYVFGSTKNASAGPGSDIDLLVHIRGSDAQREQLATWFDGWSRCLAEMNYLKTGYRCPDLLDVHFVTDADIAQRTSYAIKIGAVTDAARQLTLRTPPPAGA
jgi:hypothetical protein